MEESAIRDMDMEELNECCMTEDGEPVNILGVNYSMILGQVYTETGEGKAWEIHWWKRDGVSELGDGYSLKLVRKPKERNRVSVLGESAINSFCKTRCGHAVDIVSVNGFGEYPIIGYIFKGRKKEPFCWKRNGEADKEEWSLVDISGKQLPAKAGCRKTSN